MAVSYREDRMNKILPPSFYRRKTLFVAKNLLGKYLVRKIGKKNIAGKIIEVEAYNGPKDLASHASRGKTKRNEVMFGDPGHWYIYLVYGMHFCLNIVTEKKGYPAAVLIRSVETESGEINGPGRVCRSFKIDLGLNNAKAFGKEAELWIEDRGEKIGKIKRTPRIGVDYAKDYKDKLWRYSR